MSQAPCLNIKRILASAKDLMIGSDVRYIASVDSTNRLGRDLPETEWRNGTVLITDYQSQGSGRQGRTWVAPMGSSLLLSILLRPVDEIEPIHFVMLAALGTANAIEDATDLRATLKWPNDVLINGRKVCGVLAESSTKQGRRLVLGIGININFDPLEIDSSPETVKISSLQNPTTLSHEVGHFVDREELAIALFKRLNLWYSLLIEDPERVFSAWAERLDTVGSPVEVSDTTGKWEGIATGVQQDGALVVQDDEGKTHVVYAADVSLRQLSGFARP